MPPPLPPTSKPSMPTPPRLPASLTRNAPERPTVFSPTFFLCLFLGLLGLLGLYLGKIMTGSSSTYFVESGPSSTYFGHWQANTGDRYPKLSISPNSDKVTVVLMEGWVGTDIVSLSGILDMPAGGGTTGWKLEGPLYGDFAIQGTPTVKIQINPDGKTGSVWWRGSSFSIKRDR